ncbi:hypothetical protein Ciccas_009954 [Cichlidogyrus casuarinus]|uniref:C2H2-type domain-containing protein n=1 Tax=Cichlidogyrus casuarinus TaxID=1844966 RepID=A0ABD2Q030_9PLAT
MKRLLLTITVILVGVAATSKLEVDLTSGLFACDVVANVTVREDVIRQQATPHKVASTAMNGAYDPIMLTSNRQFMNISCKRCHEDLDGLKYEAHKAYVEHRSGATAYKRPSEAPGMIVLRLVSTDEEVVRIERRVSLEPKKAHSESNDEHWSEEGDERQVMYLDVEELLEHIRSNNGSSPFELMKVVLTAQFLGRSQIEVDILWMNTISVRNNGTGLPPNKPAEYVGYKSEQVRPPHYSELEVAILASAGEHEQGPKGIMVTVLLVPSVIYTAFDWGAVTVVLMLAFSVGTCTNPAQFADKLHKPMPIIAGTFVQTVSMPLVSNPVGSISVVVGHPLLAQVTLVNQPIHVLHCWKMAIIAPEKEKSSRCDINLITNITQHSCYEQRNEIIE